MSALKIGAFLAAHSGTGFAAATVGAMDQAAGTSSMFVEAGQIHRSVLGHQATEGVVIAPSAAGIVSLWDD